jgi:hypothetical protein
VGIKERVKWMIGRLLTFMLPKASFSEVASLRMDFIEQGCTFEPPPVCKWANVN